MKTYQNQKQLPNIQTQLVAAKKLLATRKPVEVTAPSTVIATNNTWTNATVIERNPAWVDLSPASYVWGANDPTNSAAVVAQSFRIRLGDLRRISSAQLKLSTDNYGIVLINGEPVLIDQPNQNTSNFNPGRTFNVRPFLLVGRNDIVIAGFNFPQGALRSPSNPAGIAALLQINMRRR